MTPMGLSGLAAHLFWTEPSNLLLVRLVGSGALSKLLLNAPAPTDSAAGGVTLLQQEQLLLVLAHLFGRVPLHPSLERAVRQGALVQESPSMVRCISSLMLEEHKQQTCQHDIYRIIIRKKERKNYTKLGSAYN